MAKVSDLIAFNLDPALMVQSEVMSKVNRIIDLKAINGLRLMSTMSGFNKASARISFTGPTAALIGSGDFHHLSLAILMKINTPFTLVVFDNHTDLMDMNSGYISCGSWVRESFRLDNLKSVILIGVSPHDEALKFIHPFSKPVRIIPSYTQSDNRIIDAVIREIDTKAIYISIDKDVLNKNCALTNWNQGTMDLDELLDYLSILSAAKELMGMDICGEWKINTRLFMTDYDIEAVKKNEAANIRILETVS